VPRTDIGAEPTEERGKYMMLYFNSSAVNKDVHAAWRRRIRFSKVGF
jgi:hypothetical protein